MHPSISVVVPTYNRRERLLAAVASALAQTLVPLEVIVVDDASTDGSAEALSRAYPPGSRVRLVRMQVNGGACRARNIGVSEAQGDWIAFLDSDDAWMPEKLARQVAALKAVPDAVASFTGMLWLTPGREPKEVCPPEPFKLEDLFFENTLGGTSSALVSRRALREVGGFDPAFPSCQDWDLWLRLVGHAPVVIVPAPLTLYDDGGHERISRATGKVLAGNQMIFDRIYNLIRDSAMLKRVRAAHLLFKSDLNVGHGRLVLAFILAARSHCLAPSPRARDRMLSSGVWLGASLLPSPTRQAVRRCLARAT